jgi:uncharacterized protein YaaQ
MAPRRKMRADATPAVVPLSSQDVAYDTTAATSLEAPVKSGSTTVLPKLPEGERKRVEARRAIEQQNTRTKMKNLKRAKQRDAKRYVNVPLDQETKRRLVRAALENDVKMTTIMQAAIDVYLTENDY